jgi:hypothetical protein
MKSKKINHVYRKQSAYSLSVSSLSNKKNQEIEENTGKIDEKNPKSEE